MRQHAWLNAVPRAPEDRKKPRAGSRLEDLKAKGREPQLPDVSLAYLVEYLFEVGPVESGGFGPQPVSHLELLAWQVNSRRWLQPWEIAMIRRLSAEWAAQLHKSEDHDCPAPWQGEVLSDIERGSVAMNLRDAIRKIAK